MIINKRIGNTHPIISVIGVFIGLAAFWYSWLGFWACVAVIFFAIIGDI
jgi:hypothetical protein